MPKPPPPDTAALALEVVTPSGARSLSDCADSAASMQTRKGTGKLLDHGIDRLPGRIGQLDVVLVGNEVAHALAVDALPSPEAARAAVRCLRILRAHGYLDEFGSVAISFSSPIRPWGDTLHVLRDAEVYVVTDNLQESAELDAQAFLDAAARSAANARNLLGLPQLFICPAGGGVDTEVQQKSPLP